MSGPLTHADAPSLPPPCLLPPQPYRALHLLADPFSLAPPPSQPYGELQAGLLTIVEVIPGTSVSADTTQELERGYWPSYNVPYFPEVYNRTG